MGGCSHVLISTLCPAPMGLGLTERNGSVVIVTFGLAPEGKGPAVGVLGCACAGWGMERAAKVDKSSKVAIVIVSTK